MAQINNHYRHTYNDFIMILLGLLVFYMEWTVCMIVGPGGVLLPNSHYK